MRDKLKRLLILVLCFTMLMTAFPAMADNQVEGYSITNGKSAWHLYSDGHNLTFGDKRIVYEYSTGLPRIKGFIGTDTSGYRVVRSTGSFTDGAADSAYKSVYESNAYIDSVLRILYLGLGTAPTNLGEQLYEISSGSDKSYTMLVYKFMPHIVMGKFSTEAVTIDSSHIDDLQRMDLGSENPDNNIWLAKKLLANIHERAGDFNLKAFYDAHGYTSDNVKVEIGKLFSGGPTDETVLLENLQALYEITKSVGAEKNSSADDKQNSGNAGSSTVTPGSDESTSTPVADTNTWYIAAWKVACGNRDDDTNWKLDDKYKDAANLTEIGDDRDAWKTIYDILSVAYSKGPDNASTWDPNQEMLKKAFGKCNGLGKGLAPNGVTTYKTTLTDLSTLEAAGAEDEVKRLQSFYERITALYHVSTLKGVNFDDDTYSWIKNYYENNNDNITMPSELFPTNEQIGTFLEFGGTQYTEYPSLQDTGNPMVLPYLLNTVWEMPYLTKYLGEPLNEAINNSTILSRQNLYDGLCGIKRAVDELGMPVMQRLWEMDFGDDTLTYRSLKAMYEACQNDDKIKAEQGKAKTDLSTGKPMADFILDYQKGILSENYVKAIAYTSSMVPMKTNVYSDTWRATMDEEVKQQFYDLWGFHRKALFKDRTTGAGEKYYTTHKKSKGDLTLCTLRDLLNSNGDIVLYLDDNFYNVAALKENLGINPTYGNEETSSDDSAQEESKPWYSTLGSAIEEAFNASLENVLKTGANTNYSLTYYKMMDKISGSHTYYPEADDQNIGNKDSSVMPSGKINYYLKYGEEGSKVYSPLQSYAVVSSIYRDGELFNMANSEVKQRPVFISSRTAPYAKGASEEQRMVIYNYALVKNLKASMPVGYSGNLDMDCPLYMDILGDIVTESGTVVIPAVSNATIMNHKNFNESMWGAGLFTVYGLDYQIPVKDDDSQTIGPVIAGIFEPDDSGKHYVPVARTLGDDYTVDMSRLSATSKNTMQVLYERTYNDLDGSRASGNPLYDFDSFFQICMEVLRGAPIENIDKDAEGLSTSSRIDRAGIVAAAKLEELNKSLGTDGENTTIALPNLAFMNGFNYIALIAFKLILLAVLVVNMVTVYYDTVSESLTLGTFGKCLWAMVLTTAIIVTVPAVFDVTYYQANKTLLQNETSYLSMLNLEKRESGVEIGVTEIKDPDSKTDVYIKLEDIDIPWYDLFYNSVHTDSYNSLNKMYETYAEEHSTIGKREDVQIKNDGVYIGTLDVFDSTSIDVDMSSSDANKVTLAQTASTSTSTFSFYSPYYAILDALVANVNYFNSHPLGDDEQGASQGWYSYTTKTQKGGKIKTMGLIEPYLTSSRFMEDDMKDQLGLKAIYAADTEYNYLPDPATANLYSSRNKNAMLSSYWYPMGMTHTEVEKRIAYLTKEARAFVADNKDLLGKISDETFLKVMALDIALKHNRIIGAAHASAYEIANLSSDDLIRLSAAKRGEVMINSALSYPRFIYTVGGTPSILVAAMLSMVMWVSGIVKPLLVIVAFLAIFVSVFIFKICMRKPGVSLYGYLLTTLMLCGTNILYAVLLKLSLYLPSLGLTTFMCLIIQIIVQIVYMVILLQVVWTAFRDWRDLGFTRYAEKFQDMKIGLFSKLHKSKGEGNPNFEGSTRMSDPDANWNYYDNMLEERKRRNR